MPDRAIKKLDRNEVEAFSKDYKEFMKKAKTVREFVKYAEELAKSYGFKNLDEVSELKPGDKVYKIYRGKTMFLAVIGKKPISEGVNLVVGHIDVPHVDLKPSPLYEKFNLAMFKTHYYGGIKKYQRTAIPLELRGIVVKKDGTKVEVCLGCDPNDPILTIVDIAPHIAKQQRERKATEVIKGEELQAVVGNEPEEGEEKEAVKKRILKLLKEKYGIEEEDFYSAELELVPAREPRDLGIDRSMIAAFGHDDRVCSYAALRAIVDIEGIPEKTAITRLVDREEIGSDGDTGAKAMILENFISHLARKRGESVDLTDVFLNSKGISADVTAGIDPVRASAFDPQNAAKLGYGLVITKYTGHGGKYMAHEARAELVAFFRKLFDENGVPRQSGSLGKVDEGGGGTVCKYLAQRGFDIVDMGVAVLNLHAPLEVVNKADVYAMYKGFKVFFEKA